MHYFPALDEQKILWGMSYQNLSMYLATIPSYDTEDEKKEPEQKGTLSEAEIQKKQLQDFFKST